MKSPKSCFAHIGQTSIRNILGFLLMLSLLVSLFPTVSYAASSSQQDKVTEIIEDCGDTYKVVHPNKTDILDKFETKYVKSGKGHSIYSFWDSEGENKRPHTVLEGTEVTVLAEHDGMSFCYYESSKGTEKVGWVGSQWLVDSYSKTDAKKVSDARKQEVSDLIAQCGDTKNVEHPKAEYILPEFETKYVKSGKGHSIYSFWDSEGENKRPHTVLEATEVTVLALKDGMSFCMYEYSKGTEKVGWLGSQWLVDEYEGAASKKVDSEAKQEMYDIIEDCGDSKNVVYPNDSDILDKFETKYVKSGKGHSIYSFWDPDGENKRPHTVLEKTEVTVMAEYDGMSFCFYESSKGTEKVGWVGSQWLVDKY